MSNPAGAVGGRRVNGRRALLALGTVVLLLWSAQFLMRLPGVGAADRGDYHRVAVPAGVRAEPPPVGSSGLPLLRRTYAKTSPHLSSGGTSAAVAVVTAARVGPFGSASTFDLRDLGFVYLLAAGALVLGLLAAGVPAGVCLVLTWVFVDPGYLAYMNSLYSEPPALVALLGITLWLVRWGGEGPRARGTSGAIQLGLLAIMLLVVGMSRLPASTVPALSLVALLGSWLRQAPRLDGWGKAGWGLVVAVAIAGPLHFAVGKGPRFAAINNYHSVFLGVASVSRTPEAALEGLGIPRRFAHHVGKSYFESPPEPELERALAKASVGRRLVAYVRESGALLRVASRVTTSLAAGSAHADYESAGAKPRDEVFWRFSLLRRTILRPLPLLVWLVPAGSLALAGLAAMRRVRLVVPAAALVFLALVCFSQVIIAVVGDGLFGLGRHLLLARYACDSLLGLLLWEGLTRVMHKLGRRRLPVAAGAAGAAE